MRARFDPASPDESFDDVGAVSAPPAAGPESYRVEADRARRRVERERGQGEAARRIVTITGHGAEGYATRNGTRGSTAQRYRQLPRHERDGFRPDRVAMWAFLLGLVMVLAAAASSHAAVLVAHHALSLR